MVDLSLFNGFSIFEDPDEGASIYLIMDSEQVLYATLSEFKADEVANMLSAFYEFLEADDEPLIYEFMLDDIMISDEDFEVLKTIETFMEEDDD